MMKHFFLFSALAASALNLQAQITETATEAVENMGVGWNLGNTLDASRGAGTDVNATNYWGQQGLDSETYWGQPETQPELFAMMKAAGFDAIRVPVTWFNHMDPEGNVDAAWMARVRQVVDYVLQNGLYCILNVHHDTGADSQSHVSWIKASETVFGQTQTRYEKLWQQIAQEFKDYGKELLFEAYNEMLDSYSSWCFASFSAPSYKEDEATAAYNGLNQYAQSFVSTVRQTGGNNASRNLIVNTYAASCGTGTWNQHLQDPLKKMLLPDDSAGPGHIIFEVHSYPQIATKSGNTTSNRSWSAIANEIDGMISTLQTHLVSKGAPVIIGEWGTSNVDSGPGETDYDKRRDLMLKFADYFVRQTKAAGMGTFYWMGMSDGLCRSMPAFNQPDLAETVTKAWHGEDFQGEYPDVNVVDEYVCFEGDKKIGWGNGISIPATLFDGFSPDTQLIMEYKQEGTNDDIQLFYGDWSTKPSFIVDGQTFDGDLCPHSFYGTPDGTEHTTTFTFDADTYAKLTQKGLIVHGDCIRLYKAVLRDGTSAIETIHADSSAPSLYNLAGQQVSTTTSKGFYIMDGRKIVVR